MADTSPIDRAALQNLLAMFNGDTAFLNQVIDTYLSDGANLLATLRQSVGSGRSDDLRRAAHSLKSNSANLGAAALSALGKELEEIGRQGSVAGAAERLAEVETEFQGVKSALQKIQADGLSKA